ncbi:MAG: SLC13 family permease [Chloroflexi bacterium]|nr:SLC13 family permease [Chloroflexota bacterium]
MTVAQLFVIVLVAVPLGLAIVNRLRIDVAALIIAISLAVAQFAGMGVLGPAHTPGAAEDVLLGLSRPEVLVLLSLFIIMRGLDKTGLTRWIAQKLLAIGGQSERRLITLFTATAALLSLLMNNLAVGALLLPSAIEAARRTGIKPSKLLMPLAYGTLLGGAATYFTTANIIVSGLLAAANPAQEPLNILDFTPTGGLIALAGIAYIALFGKRLLPDRTPPREQFPVRYTTSELEQVYGLGERLWQACVDARSSLIGQTLSQAGIGERFGLTVVAIWHRNQTVFAPSPHQLIRSGDTLLIVGHEDRVHRLAEQGLEIEHTHGATQNGHISGQGVTLVEVMAAPHSQLENQTLKDIDFRKQYGFTAVALWREGESHRTDVGDFKLRMGDAFLMIGPVRDLSKLTSSPDFIVLEADPSDQPVPVRTMLIPVAIILGAVTASILGAPVYLAMLSGALLTVLSGILTMEEAYRAVRWQAIFLIAGMYSLSLAMVETGLAAEAGQEMINLFEPFGSLGLAAGAYLLTALLTQVMGGQVTALVTGPIAISAAIQLHSDPQAVAVATAIGCSASFLTPMAHPVNILMISPANYRFGDFFRLGWGLTVISFLALLAGLELFWSL